MTMEYGLVENALHSLSEAASYYNNTDADSQPDRYKFGILLVAHCAELLLKEILRRVHPAFIFADIDRYKENNSNDETIGYKLAIKRVKTIGHVELGQYEQHLIELGEVRNRLQHFKYEINGEYQKQLMCKAFSAIEHLLRHVLGEKLENYSDIIAEDELDMLREDEARIKARLADIQNEFKQGAYRRYQIEYNPDKHFKVLCPVCGQDTLAYHDNKIVCRMCNSEFSGLHDIHEADQNCITMNLILRELGRRKHIVKYECPRCEYDALIHLPDGSWQCLACGDKYDDSVYCDECGDEMPNSEHFYYTAVSDVNADDYKFLCPHCANEARNEEEYFGFANK